MRCVQKLCVLLIGTLTALPAAAQYDFGQTELSKLTGTVGAGYTGAFGDQLASSHQLGLNGSATLNGFYYNPNFLSFNVTPYYDENRANSTFRSVGNSTGVALSSSIFAGSHFPGSVSYARDYNKSGVFAIPGVPDVTTHGNSDNLGISWSETLPNLPNLTAFYNRSGGSASLYGTDETTNSSSQNIGLRSIYDLYGFQLNGTYNHGMSHAELPAFLQNQAESSSTTSNSYSVGVSHRIPLHGNAAVGYSRSDFSAESDQYHNSGTVNNVFGNVNVAPTERLGITGNVTYLDNLAGTIAEQILNTGLPLMFSTSSASHSLDMMSIATYRLPHDIAVDGTVGRREQSFLGQTYASTMFGGGVSTTQTLFGGSITALVRVQDYLTSGVAGNKGTSAISLTAATNYSRDVGKWRLAGNFNYSQNQQTLLISYLTSFYTYGATVSHPIWKVRWSGTFAGTHSGYVQQAGTSNSSESYSTTLFSRYITASAGYSNANGSGVLTPAGIAPLPVPTLTPQLLFGGKTYNFSVGSSPVRRLILSASYAVSHGNTTSPDLISSYHTKSINGLVQYRFRQMGFVGGYSRLQQGFSLTGGPPFDGTTFFVGINRWFDFF
jgi:hypothetical protein